MLWQLLNEPNKKYKSLPLPYHCVFVARCFLSFRGLNVPCHESDIDCCDDVATRGFVPADRFIIRGAADDMYLSSMFHALVSTSA
jgi:hypothetical protein